MFESATYDEARDTLSKINVWMDQGGDPAARALGKALGQGLQELASAIERDMKEIKGKLDKIEGSLRSK